MSTVNVHFTYADRKYWWVRFLQPGFSHVYLTIPEKNGVWLISPNIGTLQVLFLEIGHFLPKNLIKPAITVKFCTDVNFNGLKFPPVSCVEIVKRVLGIQKFSIFTPYQLYRYLL